MENNNKKNNEKILISGFGGGLDIVNTLPLYYLFKNYLNPNQDSSKNLYLSSIRPCPLESIKLSFNEKEKEKNKNKIKTIGKSGLIFPKNENYECEFKYKGRYVEHLIPKRIKKDVVLFSRKLKNKDSYLNNNTKEIKERLNSFHLSMKQFIENNQIDCVFFIDGGGDSLILKESDEISTSEKFTSIFKGGDAESLIAVSKFNSNLNSNLNSNSLNYPKSLILSIISLGLDIDIQGFHKNIEMLKEIGGYFGSIDLLSGKYNKVIENPFIEKLASIVKSKCNDSNYLKEYFEYCENYLVLKKEDEKNKEKEKSHTATITYHALKKNYGTRRTFVKWEPKNGVKVEKEHAVMYFIDPIKAQQLKIKINKNNVPDWAKL